MLKSNTSAFCEVSHARNSHYFHPKHTSEVSTTPSDPSLRTAHSGIPLSAASKATRLADGTKAVKSGTHGRASQSYVESGLCKFCMHVRCCGLYPELL